MMKLSLPLILYCVFLLPLPGTCRGEAPPEINDHAEVFQDLRGAVNDERSRSELRELPSPVTMETRVESTLTPIIDPIDLAMRIHALVNEERKNAGLPELAWDPALQKIAEEHSIDMMENGFVGHVNPRGENPTDRGLRAGYRCRKEHDSIVETGLAENICRNALYHATRYLVRNGKEEIERLWNTQEEIALSTVKGWMESAEHRRNVLHPSSGAEGIAVVIADDGKVYITQLFC